MVDFEKELRVALRTGKVIMGGNEVLKLASAGKGKLLILASNCPEKLKKEVEYYARLSHIPIYHAPYTSRELGGACQRGHMISSLAILDEGDSEILKVIEPS
ncbi:MAG: 50S ribosomal protein L30e [Candidatus Nezhaarchaeota archaeon]|nr:50S ribosomal protein L30e [Candidatus Nezhaarchaeota archaeon]